MIASKKSRPYTDRAIKSFLQNTNLKSNDEFYLIDNDDENDFDIKNVITNKVPKSFAENCNDMIDLADGRTLFLLSNDIIFTPNWNLPLTNYENLLLIPSCNQTHTYSFDNLKLSRQMSIDDFQDSFQSLNAIAQTHCNNKSIPFFFEDLIMGFYAFVLPSKIYKSLGYFDTEFGIGGGEDVDYRLRAIDMDIPVKYCSKSFLLHFGGKSTWDGAETNLETEVRNKKYFDIFAQKWNEDLAILCLVNKIPLDSIIKKYDLAKYFYAHDFTGAFKVVLNNFNRNKNE
jgi:GT2 family glycosyltransferase